MKLYAINPNKEKTNILVSLEYLLRELEKLSGGKSVFYLNKAVEELNLETRTPIEVKRNG